MRRCRSAVPESRARRKPAPPEAMQTSSSRRHRETLARASRSLPSSGAKAGRPDQPADRRQHRTRPALTNARKRHDVRQTLDATMRNGDAFADTRRAEALTFQQTVENDPFLNAGDVSRQCSDLDQHLFLSRCLQIDDDVSGAKQFLSGIPVLYCLSGTGALGRLLCVHARIIESSMITIFWTIQPIWPSGRRYTTFRRLFRHF